MCFSASTPDFPEPEPLPEAPKEPKKAVYGKKKAAKVKKQAEKAKGIGSTILTSPLGVKKKADTKKNTLLGISK
ncbi:MAG: hypothetical protein K9M56_04310 [Victivallales bacterium]|nr:hypothetical protein [Victivallales bacterium]